MNLCARTVLRLAGLCLILSSATEGSLIGGEPGTVGQAWWGEVGIKETTLQLMQREAHRATRAPALHLAPGRLPPEAVSPNQGSDSGSSIIPRPLLPQVVSTNLNFTGGNFSDCQAWPPDTGGTVGPSQFIVALNGLVRSFNKSTGAQDGAINLNTDIFFSSVMTPGPNFTSDPHIRYDRLSGRWFIVMIDVPGQQGTQPNRIMIAMSDSGIITGGTVWKFFQFEHDLVGTTPNLDTGNFADFPTLGIDANALYIGVNLFTSSGSFANTTAFVVQKASLISGGPIQVTAFRGLASSSSGLFTPQGADNYDPAATEGYIIGVNISGASQLELLRVSNPGGATPGLSAVIPITVSSFVAPINVQAQGTTGANIDGGDTRLLAAHLRNGSLWTAHNVGVNGSGGTRRPDRDGVRWYQLSGIATGQTPSVVQSGTLFQPSAAGNQSYWMGTIIVSGQGHAAMGFSTAGPTNFIDAATVGRLAGDPAGTMEAPATYTASTTAYTPSDTSNPRRWGDFSYTGLDPSDDMTMWTVQEWCQSSGNGYAVQVAKLLAPPPALPTNCSPSSLTQGVANVTVTIKGSAANGSGFFDPGNGFSNRLALIISGGDVTASNLTYIDPSNLTAVLTVPANAAPGARTVTVVNPDGQSMASASGLLTIVSTSGNLAPTLAAISNRTVAVGMTLLVTNVASDTDGDTLTFSLGSGAPAGANISTTTGVFNWAPAQAQIGSHPLSVIVTDNGSPSLSATQSFTVTVVQSNIPPVLAAISNRTVAVGMTLFVTNTASDTDGDALTFSLGSGAPAGANISATTGVVNWAPTQSQIGSHPLSVMVTDNGFPSLSATQSFTVTVVQSNIPPVLAAISNRTVAVGMTLLVTNSASDADGDALTFSLGSGAPAGANISATTGVLNWAPTQSQIGAHPLSVMVTDNGFPSLSATQSFTVTVVQSNSPPVLTAISNQTVAVGMTLLITNVASDTDGDALTFSLGSGAPAGANISATTGVLNWAPTQAQIGSHPLSVIVTDNGFPSLSATQSFTVTVVQSNSPPVLAAISNQTVAVGMTLLITNVASDSDGDALTFSLGSGAPAGANISATTGVLNWSPTQPQIGSHPLSVIVTDNGFPSLSATQSFTVTVVQSNSPPVLAAISNRTVAVGMTLFVTNTASDTDGDALAFSLGSGAPAGANISATAGVLSWAPTQSQIGSHPLSVIVADTGFPTLSATQNFTVTVVQSNSPPVLAAISNQTVAVGMTLLITNVASDSDGDTLTFSLGSGAPAGANISATTGVFNWSPTQSQIGSHPLTVVVADTGFPTLSATQNFTVTVVQSNSPPALAAISNQTVAVGMTLLITNVASDSDGDALTFSVGSGAPAGANISATTGVFNWAPIQSQIGSHPLSVIVTDNGFPSLSATQSFTVTVVQSNSPPVLVAISNQTVAVGMTLVITNVASDTDSDALTFSLGSGSPAGANISATTGVFNWSPTQSQIGSHPLIVIVTDNGFPVLSATQSFTLTVVQSNSPPVLAAISNQTVAVGMTLLVTNNASDADGDSLTFSLGSGAPAGANISATTGGLNWAPIQSQIGAHPLSVIVTDNGFPSLSATQSFTVTVVQSNSPPVLAAISNQTVAVGMTLLITNVASDTDGDALTFSLGPGAPAGANISATSGVFNWSPTQSQIGSHPLSVIVTDNGFPSLSATQSFTVTVVQSNIPPALAAISNQTVAVGMTLLITNVASDTDGDALTFSLGSGAPAGANISATTGVLNWSPTQSQIGSYPLSVVVTDNGFPSLSATQSFTVTVVQSNSPPVLAAISNQTVPVGMTLVITNVASDTDGDALTFSLGSDAPTGANIGATNGILSWVPNQSQIGSNSLSVIVSDNGYPSLSATQSFTVTVVQSNTPPVLAAISNQTVAVGMTLLITNVASDTDGDALTFSLGPGAPAGANISATTGEFSWAPTQAQIGTYPLSIVVTDNGFPSLSATQSFTVTVVRSNSPPVLAAIPDQTIAVGMNLLITNVASDSDTDALTFSLAGLSGTNAAIDASTGVFSWSPTPAQTGTNSFTVMVADNGVPSLTATQSFAVTVLESNGPPTLSLIPDQTIYALMPLVYTNLASDPNTDQILTFSLDSGAPPGATIDATNGVFAWTPDGSQTGTVSVAVRVTDNGLPPLSDAKTFAITIVPGPTLGLTNITMKRAILSWDAIIGKVYRVEFKTNLMDTAWISLAPDVVATGPTATLTDTNNNSGAFYRLLVVP